MAIDFLKPIGDFQYSINLEYDLFDDKKVKSFVPTSGALSIIKDVLNCVMSKQNIGNRAKLLTGAYGKGKSHLTLTLLALLSGRDKKLFANLLEKSKDYNEKLYNNIKLYIDSKKKLLPIVINTSSNSLKTNFTNSLNLALKKHGLEKLMPTTFFDVAIKTIVDWKKFYPDTYNNFEKKMGISGDLALMELQHYSQETYDNFVALYPLLTSGSIFNPMVGADITKLYEDVIKNLKQYGYNGIFVVYDEFGKFLEGSSDTKSTAEDLKLLQDLAELSARTGFEEQFNLLLISHKGIDNYVSHLSKEKVDNWKAIAGRFEKITINSRDEEIFEMVASILQKDKRFDLFCKQNENSFSVLKSIVSFENIKTNASRTGVFADVLKTIGDKFVKDCYPLHPYTLIMLPKISELVAQNERSIFTYLASNDKYSVSYNIKRNEDIFPIVEPDAVYDYFESLFKGEPYGIPIREQWEIATSAIAKLSSCENELAIKIVKTITLIYIINQFEILPPSSDLIYEIYKLHPFADIAAAFEVLRKEELLIELEYKPHIKIRRSSNNNIKEIISNEMVSIKSYDFKQIFIDSMNSKYIYPVEYNDEKEVRRYFEFLFLTLAEINGMHSIDSYLDKIEADGLVVAILVNSSEERDVAEQKVKLLKSNRVVYVIPKNPYDISSSLRKYKAIENLLIKKANDSLLVDELLFVKDDLSELIRDYLLNNYLKPEMHNSQYIYLGDTIEINRRRALSELLSQICRDIFNKTPIIVNENINRNNLSTAMRSTQLKILDGVFATNPEPYFGLTGSQNINVARSVYLVPNVITDLEHPIIEYKNCDPLVRVVFEEIEKFIDAAKKEKISFSVIYNTLTKPQYGYGLKKGVIPFYISVCIKKFKKSLVIYWKNKEVEITPDILVAINNTPELYELKVETLGNDEEEYLTQLAACFNNYTKESDQELSRFDYVVKAMQRWYMQLSQFNRKTEYFFNDNLQREKLDKSIQKFKTSLGVSEINSREFLFEKLPKIVGATNLRDIANFVARAKNIIERNTDNLIAKTSSVLRDMLHANEGASLSSILNDYLESLKETTKNHVFNNSASSFIDAIRESTNDETRTVKNLLRKMFSLRVDDFTDVIAENIEPSIKDTIEIITKYDQNVASTTDNNSYVVKFVNEDGTSSELHFDKLEEKSYQVNMFYNEIISAVEEFNESLTNAEKGQVLLEILKEMCK